jgi:hypothetical protein
MNGISKVHGQNIIRAVRRSPSSLFILVFTIFFSVTATAYQNYSDGCGNAGCHEDFRSSPYISNRDGTNWGTDLMSGHLNFIGGAGQDDCDTCHSAGGRTPVLTNASENPDKPRGCIGCHGRAGDESGTCAFGQADPGGKHCGSASGLRKLHEAAGKPCWVCHSAENDMLVLAGEDEPPYNYGRADIALTSPCVNENQFGPTGLDNDGDGAVDSADTDCVPAFFRDVAGLIDVNSNGFPDIAAIIEGGSSHVHVRDGNTNALIIDIDFGSDPITAMAVIDDISGNGMPEIALLGTRPDNNVRVQVKDSATGAKVNNIFYGSAYSAVDMTVLPDTNNNGADELLVVGADGSGGVRAQARDSLTDAETSTTFYGNDVPPMDVLTIPDVSTNGEAEVLMNGRVTASNQGRAQMRDSSTRALLRNIFFGATYAPVGSAVVNDVSGDGVPDLAQLAKRTDTGAVRIQVKRTDTGATVSTAYTGTGSEPISVIGIGDANSSGFPDIAMLVQEPDGTAKVIVRDGATGAFIRNIFATSVSNPVAMALVDDLNSNGTPELAILGDDNAGTTRVKIKDSIAGTTVNEIDFP